MLRAGDMVDGMDVDDDDEDYDDFYDIEKNIAILNFFLGIFAVLMGWISVLCFIVVGNRQGFYWKQAYFKAAVQKSAKWYDKHNPAEFGNSIDSDCNSIEHALGEKLMLVINAFTFFLTAWGLSIYLSLELGLISLSMFPVHCLSAYLIQRASYNSANEKQERYRVAGGIAEESIEGIKTIASCNAQEGRARKYQTELEPLKKSTAEMGLLTGLGWGIFYAEHFIYVGLAFYVSAILISRDYDTWTGLDLNAGVVTTIIISTGLSAAPLAGAIPCIEYIQSGRIAACRIARFIDKDKKYDGKIVPIEIRGIIEFKQVYFNYPTKPDINVLQGVSFKVGEGQSLAIAGETGSGKSTIIQLLEGFYYSSSGSVTIDGIDIQEYNLQALRKFISLVNQEPILFNCSIEDNIKIGCENASDSEIRDAALKAEASDYIEALPEKYDTWVGVKGSLLSGGQKQRIALARAIIRKPKILLLDEATSALDNNTATLIQGTIDKIMKGTTSIVIAHNLATIKNSMHILVLDKGQVVEYGTYEELLHGQGHFIRLHQIQAGVLHQESSLPILEHISDQGEKPQDSSKIPKQVYDKKQIFTRVLSLLKTYWFWLFLAALGALFAGSSIPVFSYLMAVDTNIVNGIEGDSMESDTRVIFFCLIGDALIVFLAVVLMCWALARAAARFSYDLRYQCMNSLLYYDQYFYDRPNNSPNLIASRLAIDCEKVSSIGGPVIGLQVLVLTTMLGGIIIAFIIDPILALIVTGFVPLILVSAGKGQALAVTGIVKNDLKNTSEIASDALANIKTVKAFNRESYFYEQYVKATQVENKNIMPTAHVNGVMYGLRFLVLFCMYGCVAWFGGYRVKEGDLEIGDMLITFYSISYTYLSLMIVGSLAPDIEGGFKGGKRLFKIIDYVPSINAKSGEGITETIQGGIDFCAVDFKYESRNELVLNSLSFSMKPGSSLGITGTTGSGKSTIAQLLLRFYNPIAGEILIDSKEITSYNISHLRSSISWVGQEPMLFLGSIFYNLEVARPNITETEATEAMEKAQASDIIERYGLQCSVGWRGGELSGGQKQRIAIARAIVRKPKILILDESTSALDFVTEELLLTNIRKEPCSIIAIAHRLQSIRDYDQIIVIENGSLVENGTHQELMEMKSGVYKNLFEKSQ